jgi:hypothetical protein
MGTICSSSQTVPDLQAGRSSGTACERASGPSVSNFCFSTLNYIPNAAPFEASQEGDAPLGEGARVVQSSTPHAEARALASLEGYAELNRLNGASLNLIQESLTKTILTSEI